jgi:ComF family protein
MRAIGVYEGTLRGIVHALKYDGRRSLARPLGALMATHANQLPRSCDAAVPVPLHPARLRERGFNQADDLAAHVGLPRVRALTRVRRTAVQADLNASERQDNVRAAFAPTRHVRSLAGCVVTLIDDVSTTGATLNACAEVLRHEGVDTVFALTAARAVTKWR